MLLSVGVDLGATKILFGLVDNRGSLIRSVQLKTPTDTDPLEAIAIIVDAIKQLVGTDKIRSIGFGVAGQIDSSAGLVKSSPNLPKWLNIPLQHLIYQSFEVPVAVTNDVRAAAWGEWIYGAGRGYSDLICLFVGTGIGGGIICGGRVLEGSGNVAGELGHISLDMNGPMCSCGNRGCFEALAGGWAIARKAKEAVELDPVNGAALLKSLGCHLDDLDARKIFLAASKGDSLALAIVENVKKALVAGTIGIIHAFNPAVVILGGGVIDGNPILVNDIREGVFGSAIKASLEGLKILPSELMENAVVLGAAAFSIHQ